MPRGRSPQSDERQARTLTLRRAGWRYADIARELGYASESGARNAYDVAMRRTLAEPAEDLRRLHHERLEDLIRRAYAIAVAGSSEDRALRAIDRLVALLDRDARLMGLDAPTRSRVTVITEDVVDAEIARLSAELEQRSTTA